jgi:ferric-chelate reductase
VSVLILVIQDVSLTSLKADNLAVAAYNQRAGFMAVAQLPFIIGLAGKNNVISLLTGISHEKVRLICDHSIYIRV